MRYVVRPTRKEIAVGIDAETVSVQDRPSECAIVYLMNLFDQYGGEPGGFRHELRRCLLLTIADAIGEDWDLSEP